MPRLVYSLHFQTEREPGAEIIEFVVNLNRGGNSRNIRPVGKSRVVDLRPGNEFMYGTRRSGSSSPPCRHTGSTS